MTQPYLAHAFATHARTSNQRNILYPGLYEQDPTLGHPPAAFFLHPRPL